MEKSSYNGKMPKEFTARIKVLVDAAMQNGTIKEMMARMSPEAKTDFLSKLILASI